MRSGAVVIAIIFLSVFHPAAVRAHKVSLFAYQEKGTVRTEAYFADGTPCRNAKLTAFNMQGSVVAEGYTDEGGLFSFPYALSGDLTITVRASLGHGSEFLLSVDKADIVGSISTGRQAAVETLGRDVISEGNAGLDEAAIEKIVEDRIGPIRDTVQEIRRKQGGPTLGRILGGLGWIVGLAGAYLWGLARGRKKVES